MIKPADAAKEILALAEASERLGGPSMSDALRDFVSEMATTSAAPAVKRASTIGTRKSANKAPRVGARVKRITEADMSKTIDELAQKLREAFYSDDQFERVLTAPETQGLSKANVVTLYNRVFQEPRPISKSMTKPDVFNAIRRERISRVRSGY